MLFQCSPVIKERGIYMAEEKKSRYTEAQNRATQKYIRENLEEIKFRVRKGEKDRYKVAAEKAGMSMAKFFLTAADEKMSREAIESPTRPITSKMALDITEGVSDVLGAPEDRRDTNEGGVPNE